MKQYFICILIAGLCLLSSCKRREIKNLPDKDVQPVAYVFAQLPPFHEIFKIFDYLKLSDYDKAIPDKVYTTKRETGRSAFALGVLTADGIISVRGHNKTKLNKIAKEMISISNFLGLDASILSLADQLKELIEKDQWEELEKALEHYKSEVEGTLYQSQQFDQFTMMQLGGWVEGINRIGWFIQQHYQTEKTKVLHQTGTLNHLIVNLELIATPSIKDERYYRESLSILKEIQKIEQASTLYTREQVNELVNLTHKLKEVFI